MRWPPWYTILIISCAGFAWLYTIVKIIDAIAAWQRERRDKTMLEVLNRVVKEMDKVNEILKKGDKDEDNI